MPRTVLTLMTLAVATLGLLLAEPAALALGPETAPAPRYATRPDIDPDGLKVAGTSPALGRDGAAGGETRPNIDPDGLRVAATSPALDPDGAADGETRPNIDPNG